jgi:hypothetical protein
MATGPEVGSNERMPYAEGRTFHDADSHVMELPEWLPSYAEPGYRDRIPPFSLLATGSRPRVEQMITRGKARAGTPAERAGHEEELMTRKSWDAYGAFHADDRRRALDRLGFRSQLVFSTFAPTQSEEARDVDLSYAMSRALTRGIVEFCSHDPRLLPATFVPHSSSTRCSRSSRSCASA